MAKSPEKGFDEQGNGESSSPKATAFSLLQARRCEHRKVWMVGLGRWFASIFESPSNPIERPRLWSKDFQRPRFRPTGQRKNYEKVHCATMNFLTDNYCLDETRYAIGGSLSLNFILILNYLPFSLNYLRNARIAARISQNPSQKSIRYTSQSLDNGLTRDPKLSICWGTTGWERKLLSFRNTRPHIVATHSYILRYFRILQRSTGMATVACEKRDSLHREIANFLRAKR